MAGTSLGQNAGRRRGPSFPTDTTCPSCGQHHDPNWNFCPHCGHARGDAPRRDTAERAPRGLGSGAHRVDAVPSWDDQDFRRIPGVDYDRLTRSGIPTTRRRRKRRSRTRWYRRKLVLIPSLLALCLLIALAGLAYRATSLLTSVQAISTPPPVVTDSTYIEGVDPDMPAGPISIETGPAQEAVSRSPRHHELPQPANDGFAGQLQDLTTGLSDLAGGAAVASGVKDGSNEKGFTVLLMGVDARPGAAIDIGVRPDVLMLVRFDPQLHACRMLSIPRDTRVELPGYGQSRINHALMVGGIPYQLLVTEAFIGQPIDHYVLLDFEAFETAVDTVGGVTVTIPEELREDGKTVYTAGVHQFNGEEALAFARHRAVPDGDLGRVERQWSLLGGLAEAAQGRDLIDDVNTLVPMVEDHIRTDLSLTEMAGIARDYGRGCLSTSWEDIAMLRGARVQLPDPILDQVAYYNVVPASTVEDLVDDLLVNATTPSISPFTIGGGALAEVLTARWRDVDIPIFGPSG